MKYFLILLSLGFFISGCKNSAQDQEAAKKTIQAFAGSCRSSSGQWTQKALNQARTMVNLIEDLKASLEDDCAGLNNALNSALDIQSQLARLGNSPEAVELKVAEETRNELFMTLERVQNNDPNNQELIDALHAELLSVELDIAKFRAENSISRDEQRKWELINGLGAISSYVASIQQGNLARCMEQSPSAPFQMGVSLLTIGGSFASANLGASLAFIGSLFDQTFRYVRSLPLDKAKLDFENVQMQTAMTCAFESMSNLYCDAKKSKRLVEFALENYEDTGEPSAIWKGMDLLGEELPILNRWIVKVANGVDPGDEFAAKRLNEIWDKQNDIRKIRNLVVGELESAERLIDKAPNDKERELRMRAAFKAIILEHLYLRDEFGRPQGPITDFIGQVAAVCRLSGDPACEEKSKNTAVENLIDEVEVLNGFSGLEDRTRALVEEVQTLISNELRETINQDPKLLVAEAVRGNAGHSSVLNVLRDLSDFAEDFINFSEENSLDPADQRIISVVEATKALIDQAARRLSNSEVPATEVIEFVFKEFKLLKNIQYLNERVRQLVLWDLDLRLRLGDLPEDITKDLRSSSRDIVAQFERTGLTLEDNGDEIINDLSEAQRISRQNLDSSFGFFSEPLIKTLKSMKKMADRAGEQNWNDPSHRRLAMLCTLIATTSVEWPEDVDPQLCEGAIVHSAYKKSGLKLEFDKLYQKRQQPIDERVCTYSNFLQASRLFTRADENEDDDPFSRHGLKKATKSQLERLLSL